ncbi:MAG: protocatechuate 3,4-dioxygenase subunit alpha, partial [Polyangiales bacterium]
AAVSGEHLTISGTIYDGAGLVVPDAVLEIWQADTHGRYSAAPGEPAEFVGFARVPTDAQGRFSFRTVKPGRVPGPEGRWQAPHLAVTILMRGLLKPVQTRLYFPNEPANHDDPALGLVPPARRNTLIAQPEPGGLRWDVHLQGERETVFFQF